MKIYLINSLNTAIPKDKHITIKNILEPQNRLSKKGDILFFLVLSISNQYRKFLRYCRNMIETQH